MAGVTMRIASISALLLSLAYGGVAQAANTSRVVVLHDNSGFPEPRCRACVRAHIVDIRDDLGGVDAVILTGHSTFGSYLGLSAPLLARTLARLGSNLEFLVIDSCYGAQAELLSELDRAGVRPRVTFASPAPVAPRGFDYGDILDREEVTAETLAQRWSPAQNISAIPAAALPALPALIADTRAEAAKCGWNTGLVSVLPNLAPARVPGVEGAILVHLPPSDFPRRCFAASRRPDRALPRWLTVLASSVALLVAGAAAGRWLRSCSTA